MTWLLDAIVLLIGVAMMPFLAIVLDEMVEQSRLSERMANRVAVEHLAMRRRSTPAMHLTALKAAYANQPGGDAIIFDLERAFSLGHEFGVERAANVVDQCNREGPYNAIGAASRIRALKIVSIKPVNTIGGDFLIMEGVAVEHSRRGGP